MTRLHGEREITDLTALLRQELSRRGAEVDDEAWLAEAVRHLREGNPVVVDEPGSDVGPPGTDPGDRA